MKKLIATVVLALLVVGMSTAQPAPVKAPTSPGEVLDHQLSAIEREVVSAAEAMPADKYDFAPTSGEFKGVRTFAQQVKHIASVNFMISASLLGEKPPATVPDENGAPDLKSKEQIVQFLKDSFAYAHKAAQSVSGSNYLEVINGPFGGTSPRLGLTTMMMGHCFDHYGQMVEYLRMNEIIPPASRQ